ncbi:low-density lipoprotein receptor-related protein 12 [Syngnathus acus]|uniref:low-density lipoprotein receptor-related protein 12 n=1 Tax=Syngnathus acus TaxID=161584 RepID=UPI0018862AD1|nr:low-density lipoprotein receptor-related protein 12 [Syngnathus acus]
MDAIVWGVFLLFLTGCHAASQRNDNVLVSGISNACGESSELLRASSGVIASPGWPFQYPTRLNCSWNIRGRPGDRVTISFQDFDLQGSHRCSSDWMSISSYKNLDGLRVCGSSLPPPYISSQDHVWIHFRSDDALSGKGFRLSYVTGKPDVSSCDVDQFHCSNGKCIPDWWRCNSMDECGDNSDEDLCVDSPFSFQPCSLDQFPCLSRYTRIYTCLPHSLRCDGSIDCQDLGDEIDCQVPTCGEWLRNFYGSFSSPNYPDFYPPGSNCTWLIDTGDHRKVILRFTDFKLDGTGYGDYVKVYDGLEENPRRLLRVLTAFDSRAPVAVVSSSGQLRVHFYADKINAARGFNVTYQVDGFCLPWEVPCGGNWGCYTAPQRCDGYWHCPNGRDELNCSACQEDEFPCSRNGACYPRSDRCNYQNRCPNGSDEKNCLFCQPGNFHCKNNRCVFESWVCDAQDDCGDGSDEESCPVVVPTRVIAAAVIGSLVCGLLLVIALGCTCKLYSLRVSERRSFETQLSRVEAELLRREAPPSYGQLIAQGLIPPVEDFPVCSGSQASVLENLRLAVRSQLGFTSLRLPSASSRCRRGLWRSLFNFSRSRQSGSLALVSADVEDSGATASSASDPPSPDSDDTDTESERVRERGVGAAGGPVAPLPHKSAPATSVGATVSSTASVTPANPPAGICRVQNAPGQATVAVETADSDAESHGDSSRLRAPPASTLHRLTQNLHRLARNIMTSSRVQQNQTWGNHSPLRQLDTGRGAESTEQQQSADEDDVELLIPESDSSSFGDVRQPLLDPQPSRPSRPSRSSSTAAQKARHQDASGPRDGPCDYCGKVHTAQIPDRCLEVGGKMESSDDELLQLC